MSASHRPDSDLWPPSLARHLDAVCNRFEDAWKLGRRPRIAEFLEGTPAADRPVLLRELLGLDLAYRYRSGDVPTPLDYCRQLPEYAELICAAFGEAATASLAPASPGAAETGGPGRDARRQTGTGGGPSPAPDDADGLSMAPTLEAPGPGRDPAWPAVTGYEILGVLGRGGMGIVYRAVQVRLKRLVALKMLQADDKAEPQQHERFRAEAEAVARLQHPHIIQIYEIGEQAGRPYLALEYVDGGSLAERLRGTPLPPPQAARLLETLARAVHHAHQAGIVHRDLKPANVLLQIADCRLQIEDSQSAICDPQSAIPKITDFGLAKQLDVDSGRTRSGVIVGTPSYMAPEQARGQNREIGPAADVHALGTILYETLTGVPPFRGATVLETLAQVLSQEPLPPSRLQPGVPRDLETICLKCLEKEPARRYASALDLADDLKRFLNGEPIHARPTPAWERGLKWVKRRPTAAGLLAVSTITLLSLLVGTLFYQEQRARVAESDKRAAEGELRERQRTDDLRGEASDLVLEAQEAVGKERWQDAKVLAASALAKIGSEPSLAGLQAQAQRLLAEAEQRLTAHDKYQRFGQGRNAAIFHGTLFAGVDLAANLKASREAAEKALALFAVSADRDSVPVLDAPLKERRAEITAGCYELLLILAEVEAQQGTPPQVRKAVEILDRAAKLGPRTKAYHLRRARYLALLQEEDAARLERERARAAEPASALDYFLLGEEQQRAGKAENLRAAVGHFENAVRLQADHFWAQFFLAAGALKLKRPDLARGHLTACLILQPPDFPWVYLLRGFAHAQLNELPAAEADFQQALALHPDADARYNLALNLGVLRMLQKRYPEAVARLREAVRLRPEQYQAYAALADVDQRQTADTWPLFFADPSPYLKLAAVCLWQGDLDRAAEQLDRAVEVARANAAQVPDLQLLYRSRGRLHLRRNQPGAALRDFRQAIDLEPRAGPSPEVASDHVTCARILRQLEKYPEAEAAYEAALKVNPGDAEAQLGRARLLLDQGRYDEAARSLDRYLEQGKPSAEVYRLRGLARAWLGEFPRAVEDYTRALALQADSRTHAYRGWAYLFQDSPRLALHDFQEAIRLDANNGDAYNGRGFARTRLGQYRQGVADADHALACGPEQDRMLCNAARVYAQAVGQMDAAGGPRSRRHLEERWHYHDQALRLLRRAVSLQPRDERAAFWRQIAPDPALLPIRNSPGFAQMTREYSRPAK
jgi:serine/threonine protein kinase/Tfp pilus assembly protein PilF